MAEQLGGDKPTMGEIITADEYESGEFTYIIPGPLPKKPIRLIRKAQPALELQFEGSEFVCTGLSKATDNLAPDEVEIEPHEMPSASTAVAHETIAGVPQVDKAPYDDADYAMGAEW